MKDSPAMIIGAILITLFCWGLAPVLDGQAARNASALRIMFWGGLIGAVYVSSAGILFGASLNPDPRMIVFTVLAEFGSLLGWLAYFRALNGGRTSEMTAVASAYPLAAIVFLFLLGQGTSLLVIIGASLIVFGLFAMQWQQRSAISSANWRSFLIALMAALCWGLWVAGQWKALHYGSVADVLLWSVITFALFIAGVGIFARRREGTLRLPAAAWRPLLLGILIVKSGTVAFILALDIGNPAVVIAISASYPLVTFFAAWIQGEEQFNLWRLVSISTIVLGAVLAQIE